MFFFVVLHHFGSLAPYCVVHFCLNLLGFSFIFWWFSHPAVLLIQVENGLKEKKTNNKRHHGGTCECTSFVCQGERTSPFIRLRGIFLHYSHQVFSVQTFLHFRSFHHRRPNKNQGFLFSSEAHQLISITVFVRTEKKHSKADKRRKSQRGVEVMQPQQIKT